MELHGINYAYYEQWGLYLFIICNNWILALLGADRKKLTNWRVGNILVIWQHIYTIAVTMTKITVNITLSSVLILYSTQYSKHCGAKTTSLV